MTKRTLLTALLGMALVLGLASAGFATPINPFWGYSDKPLDAYHTVDPTLLTTFYGTGVTYSTPQVLAPLGATSTQIHGTMNLVLSPGWSLTDTVTVSLYSTAGGLLTSLGSSGFHTETGLSYKALYFDLYGAYVSGAQYYMTVLSSAGSNDQWRLSSDSFSFETGGLNRVTGRDTPLPAAVWLLGSGLLGLMGFKTARKNAA